MRARSILFIVLSLSLVASLGCFDLLGGDPLPESFKVVSVSAGDQREALAVGATAPYQLLMDGSASFDPDELKILSVTSSDPATLRVAAVEPKRYILEALRAGSAEITIKALPTGADEEVTVVVNTRAEPVERLISSLGCDPALGAPPVLLSGQRVEARIEARGAGNARLRATFGPGIISANTGEVSCGEDGVCDVSTGDGAQPLRITSTLVAGVLHELEVVTLGAVDDLKFLETESGTFVESFSEPPPFIAVIPTSQGRLVCQAAVEPAASSKTPERCDVLGVTSGAGFDDYVLGVRGVPHVVPSYTTTGECVLQIAYPEAMQGAGVTREVRIQFMDL